MTVADNINQCVKIINSRAKNFKPRIGIILGSGLGAVSDQIKDKISIPYDELPGFSISSQVKGHGKKLHLGILNGTPVACLEGRTHIYEGAEPAIDSLKVLIRTMKRIGCEIMLTTNAVGSLRIEHGPGSLMAVEDHINFMFFNPLIGLNDEEYGDRFVSMDNAYDAELRQKLLNVAKKINVPIASGVFVATCGPTFESHAEIRMYKMMGAHAVGMSTVPETILARHAGMKVVTVCSITNFAAGLTSGSLSHAETIRGAAMAVENLAKLFLAFVGEV
jgi:xanthosine phosphorylase